MPSWRAVPFADVRPGGRDARRWPPHEGSPAALEPDAEDAGGLKAAWWRPLPGVDGALRQQWLCLLLLRVAAQESGSPPASVRLGAAFQTVGLFEVLREKV